ncbi:WXG100 family type VII secretion target [Streptomyces flaveolus]|uniref:WXG100 family type VII secretion target n=1 Tax=Streptomyces flaveolus TaxID=67297 RepID=UPI0033AB013E
MAAEDGIYIDHGVAMTFAESMAHQTQRIRTIITNLENELTPIVGNWLGPDKTVYMTKVQPAWEAEVLALSTILQKHAETLDNIRDLYRNTVQENAEGFETIKF